MGADIVDLQKPKNHTALISLFSEEGKLLGQKTAGMTTRPPEFIKEWQNLIVPESERVQSTGKQ